MISTRRQPNSPARELLSLALTAAMTALVLALPHSASNRTAPPDSEALVNTPAQENASNAAREPAAAALAHEAYGKLDLSFEANRGQTDEQVRFLARGAGYSLFLTSSEAVFVLREPTQHQANQEAPDYHTRLDRMRARENVPARHRVLRMRLEGASSHADAQGLDQLPGLVNYFIGDDSTTWRTNIPTFSRVRYAGVYPGVDLVYYGNQRQLEYDFVVQPGADWRQVSLAFEGADSLEVEAGTGDLLLKAGVQTVRQHKPFVYQETGGERREVVSGYELKGDGRIGFRVGAYDTSKQLVIDPVLVYSTYLGGGGDDAGNSIAVDAAGNAYVTGQTFSTNFPTASPIQPASGGLDDIFVTKLNASGSAFVYSTYLGGDGSDVGNGIAVDAAGNAYVSGRTASTNFPTASPIQSSNSGGVFDAFVTRLNASGSALVYSTYLGGGNSDGSSDIAVDATGNAYITGNTFSTNFPTINPVQTDQPGQDAFVTKLNAAGSALVYSTYLGGSGNDAGFAVAVDTAGNAYVTGFPTTDFPTANPFQAASSGGADAFVTKLTASGSALVYSTYFGGSGGDLGNDIAVDTAGNAYVTGQTTSTDFPTVNPIQPANGGGGFADAFVTKFNASGSALFYSTYLGGVFIDSGNDIAVDLAGNTYVIGNTGSSNFPIVTPVDGTFDSNEAFVTKINALGSALVYSTFLGGSANDTGKSIAVDSAGNAYVTGDTFSTNFPTVDSIQPGGSTPPEAFIAKIGTYLIAGRVVDSLSNPIASVTVTLSGSNSDSMQTDTNGNFLFLNTTPGGSFAVAASNSAFTFNPSSFGIGNLNTNVPDILFTGTATGPTPTPTPTPSPTPAATFQFIAASFSAGEGAGSVPITVTRSGDISQPVTVDYATTDGMANDRGDYTTAIGRLRFAAGDTAESFNVFVTDDALAEGNETVNITLSNPSAGSQVVGAGTVIFTIVDNDVVSASTNPIDSTQFFVRQHYVDLLNREPDAAGFAFWVNNIESCGADASCREVRRIETSAAFFLSIEFQETGFLVHRFYRSAFNRLSRYREFIRDSQEIGRGVIVGQPGFEAQLEANKDAFAAEFVTRADFLAIYGGLTNEQYVDALNANTADSLSDSERNALVAGLNGGTETRATVLRRVADNANFKAHEFSPAFVLIQYFGYLRRNADDQPDTDFSGYDFWLAKLNSFGGDFRAAEMVKAFLLSIEYRQRFGQP